jgi:flagellar basal-body rod modification protein FlgD
MTAISPSTTAAATPATAAAKTIGADFNMFLKMLTTQMKNQDPLDPMDTAQFTQQLAQFSQVEQTMQQSGTLREVLAKLNAQDMMLASGFIGREVAIASSLAGLTPGAPTHWSYAVEGEPASLTATITDAANQVVRTMPLPQGRAGEIRWDGIRSDGQHAAAGTYRLTLAAIDAKGLPIDATILSRGTVSGVVSGSDGTMVSVNGTDFALSKVKNVLHLAAN